MNRFSAYISLAALACLCSSEATAQPIIEDIDQITSHIQKEVSQSIASIDFEVLHRDVTRIAARAPELIEQSQAIVDRVAQLNWEDLPESYDLNGSLLVQKEKVIEKLYTVNSKHRLNIDNHYGKVAVHNWDRDQVKVTIKVRTAENSERRAQDALDRVRIDESTSGRDISLKTRISSSDSNWWSALTSGGGDRSLRIDYDIYMPAQNELTLANHYGPIELDDRSGKVTLSVSYGSLSAGRLTASGNALSVAYSNADVEYLHDADVSVRYGRLSLVESERLKLDISYSGGDIGKINREADINVKYGGKFKVGFGSDIKKANVNASYSNVSIEPAADAAFHFNVAVSYGGFDYDRNRTSFNSKSEGTTSKSYSGYWNKTVDNPVNVNARYGNISLK